MLYEKKKSKASNSNRWWPFIICTCLAMPVLAKNLPILSTKQDITNLRFISNDGKFTYYQRKSGDLLLSTNYEVKEAVKGTIGSNYEVIATPARKRLLVVQDEHYHTFYGLRFLKPIYALEWGDNSSTKLGNGIAPALHLDDSMASFYDPSKNLISFVHFAGSELNFSIHIFNSVNPYFTPQVIMPNEKTVIFTDNNTQGFPGVIVFNKETKKMRPLAKAGTVDTKYEICLGKDHIFIAQFGIGTQSKGSSIVSIPRSDLELLDRIPLYESKLNDIGNMICDLDDSRIFFIKNVTGAEKKEKFELASLGLKDKTLSIMTNLTHVTQIMNMDGKLLVPFQGKHYIAIGENDMASDGLKGK